MKLTNPHPDPTAAATLVKREWLQLIRIEGFEAAKQFLELCRLRDFSPSSHLDIPDFLEAGKVAMRLYVGSKLADALRESDF